MQKYKYLFKVFFLLTIFIFNYLPAAEKAEKKTTISVVIISQPKDSLGLKIVPKLMCTYGDSHIHLCKEKHQDKKSMQKCLHELHTIELPLIDKVRRVSFFLSH